MDKPAPLKTFLIADFTVDLLGRFLSNPSDTAYEVNTAPYDQVIPTLMGSNPPAWEDKSDITLVWTQPNKISSAFQSCLDGTPVPLTIILNETEAFTKLLAQAAQQTRLLLIPTWTLPASWRGLGVGEMRADQGARRALLEMNYELCGVVDAIPNAFVLDVTPWLIDAGPAAFDARLKYHAQCPFGNSVLRQAAREIVQAWKAFQGESRKILFVDADNTLWGGLAGEEGWEGIRIGGHDPVGEAYWAVQQALKSLQQRGILLALVSKNDEDTLRQFFGHHPEMPLSWDDFVSHNVNWENKAKNITAVCAELRLNEASAVFLDDSPQERDWVQKALPAILVPELPEDPLLYADTIQSLACFDQVALTEDDRKRSAFYNAESERKQSQSEAMTFDDWVASLDIHLSLALLSQSTLGRAAQLFNKTNQMNLSTRRMGEDALWDWASIPGQAVWTLQASDRFGDAGLVGIIGLRMDEDIAVLEDFLLSCRVLGRRIEEALLALACQKASEMGAAIIKAVYRDSGRNEPCRRFFEKSGMIFEPEALSFSAPATTFQLLPDSMKITD